VKLRPAGIAGSFLIDLQRIGDDRGFFARVWDETWTAQLGVDIRNVQSNISYNTRRGAIRGLHWQVEPHGETKLLRCTRGAIFDVAVDMRPESPTYRQWQGHRLDAESRTMVFIPAGCAHGYQALDDATEVTYQTSAAYAPDAERGIRWDDPAIGIEWPIAEGAVVSDKDRAWPLLPVEVAV
jgi:dTDP-4-dehydrorhamnose 3,5-epimerase